MSDTQTHDVASELPKTKPAGHVYVLRFSDGTIKVGKSINPGSRIANHAESSAGFGIQLSDSWISDPHERYSLIEQLALAAARAMTNGPEQRRKSEYFHGIDFGELVERCRRISPDREPASPAPVGSDAFGRRDIAPQDLATHVMEVLAAATPWLPLPIDTVVPKGQRGRAFGQLIAYGRHQQGLTQSDLAAAVGCSRLTVSRWERGHETNPSLTRLCDFVRAINVHFAAVTVALGSRTISQVADDPETFA